MTTTSPIVVALDFPDMKQALAMADQLDPSLCRVKVGKELYTATGPAILEELHKRNYEVFLDLKFHDIPNTCAKAVGVAADLGVWMVNVHASGGQRMMEAARNELEKKSHKPLLIGVTVLTSMEQSDLAGIGLDVEPMMQVERLAKLAQSSGLDGVVCSAREVGLIRDACGSEFLTVTPGIRPEGSEIGDQKRVMTPKQAVEAGVDHMVIGRPITQVSDAVAQLSAIVRTL
ncbi:MAG: orotidine-5'-phosphate decarboxylase [Thalassolituus sp.]|jgi:orotidine-5'-phosphate decarboxylase|uniref:orotidine-5'-phosphate decarboxylase n=1 Tax=Thalassolituus sp. TaxID=2030822 RepID=UPI0027D51482|nr:orotidine-5'-phosphate decarboxylase [Thalassolituus sp.]MDQ4423528.1 orotidine-5'-phosphate decarboxylase [Thalassolituus sp.]MDQ4426447.1 orotidine-5'-phosphate decarboxylase [Thalassolituus sp.]